MSNKKDIMMKIAYKLFIVLFTGFLIYGIFSKTNNRDLIYINKEIGIKGKITGINRARGYKIYINSSNSVFNLDKFKNVSIIKNEGLGYYLNLGDTIDKVINSDTLLLIRNGVKSKWIYKP